MCHFQIKDSLLRHCQVQPFTLLHLQGGHQEAAFQYHRLLEAKSLFATNFPKRSLQEVHQEAAAFEGEAISLPVPH